MRGVALVRAAVVRTLVATLLVSPVRSAAQPSPDWLRGDAPTAQARAAIALLQDAASRGLRASDYDAAALEREARALAMPGADAATRAATRATFDAALTRSVARYLAHLHEGRADPRTLGFRLPETHGALDFTALARDASRAPDAAGVAAAFARAEPPYAGYAALVRVLARYRALAADTTLRLAPFASLPLRPGAASPDAGALRRLLVALGDLPPTGDTAPLYDAALVDGVRAFQRRHGLEADGVVGPATAAALRTPLAQRVRQIELTLERWRWLPDRAPARFVVVNVPAFRLYAFEDDAAAAHPLLRMDVIVGSSEGHRHTPVFTGTMREVVFQPYWDVPPSIAGNELIPKLRRDPGLAWRDGYEIVQGGDEGARIYGINAGNLARVAAGALRLRQRPGGVNALGPVKFVFPNAFNVYLHGTPARQLFAQTRRDFSHGCIRIEDPAALAELVLRGQPGWDRAAIDAAMSDGPTRRVPIARPFGVFILYATVVPGDDGVVHFYPDIYGHDAALQRALQRTADAQARVAQAGATP